MKVLIPLRPHPNQQFDVVLNGQYCTIKLLQRTSGLFFALLLNGQLIADSVHAQHLEPVVFPDYLGFKGSIYFEDTQGRDNPTWDGLGARFQLYYVA